MVLRITVRPQGVEAPPPTHEGLGMPTMPDDASNDPWAMLPDARGVESGLVTLARARKRQDALATIDEIAPPVQVASAGPPPDEPGAADDARTAAAARTAKGAASPARTQPPREEGGSVTRDIARGIPEAPRQILGGMRDATQAAINLAEWITGEGAKAIGSATAALGGDVPENFEKKVDALDRLALPEVKKPTTVTGGVVRSVAQFLTGFTAGAGAIGGAVTLSRAAVAGALADFTAFDAHEKRLSNLIEDIPALQNPVTEYLAAKPGDGEIEGRLKRAVEGLGLGVAAEGVFRGIRYVRDWRRAANEADPKMAAARAADDLAPPPSQLLGDESGPLIAKRSEVAVDVADQAGKTRPATSKDGRERPGAPQDDLGVPDDVVARALTGKGLQPLTEGGKDAVYVNFAAFKTSDDVKRAIADTAEAFKGDIVAARRGVRTHAQTKAAAGREDAWAVLEARRSGEPLNAEQSLAARRLWEGSAEKLIETAEAAAKSGTAEDLFAFRRMLAIHKDIQTEVIAARTETARALNAWAIPVGAAGKARMASIDNLLVTYGGPEASGLLARKVAGLRNLDEGMSVLDDVVAKAASAKTIDVVKEIWINALLSNPKTHVVNMLGNSIALGQELVERMAAGGFSRAIGSGQIMPGEAAAKTFALSQGIREGFWLAGKALHTGESQFGAATTKTAELGFERAISPQHLGLRAYDPATDKNWFGGAVDAIGTIVNTPTRFLTAEDDFFKAIGYRTEVAAQALRQASREVSDGAITKDAMKARVAELMANPPDSIKMAATDYARYLTYTSEPGVFVQAVNRVDRQLMASDNPGKHIGSLAMRMLIPFRNTPANLMSYAFERTPLAPLMSRYREAIARGGAEADLARTRMALGTMTALLFVDLALDGHITGAGPKDDKDRGTRDTLLRSGWQPYSIKVGERYFSYSRTDPFGLSLGIAANIAELTNNAALDEDKQDEIFELVAAASASYGNMLLDRSYMSSVSDTIDVLHKPNKAAAFIERRLAAFMPAVVGEARRQVDPFMRYTHDLTTEVMNRTPGLSETLPLARDVWGRARKYESGLGATYDALSPIASKKLNPEPVDREAIKHDFNIAPPVPMLNFGIGLNVSLRNKPEAYSRYLELRGQAKPSDIKPISERTLEIERRATEKGITWQQSLKSMKVPQKNLSQTSLLYLKYGDVALLPLINAIVAGDHPLSKAYETASPGRNGGKDKLIAKAIADYGRAAKARVVLEFPDVAAALQRKIEGPSASQWSAVVEAGED